MPEFQYTISVALSEGSMLFGSLMVLAQQSQKTNNRGWYSLFSSFRYNKMTSTDISYQSRLSKLVMIIRSSTCTPYDIDTFHFISVTLFCFLSNQYVLALVFLPFQLILLFSFCSLPYTFEFPFILLILLFPLSTCI